MCTIRTADPPCSTVEANPASQSNYTAIKSNLKSFRGPSPGVPPPSAETSVQEGPELQSNYVGKLPLPPSPCLEPGLCNNRSLRSEGPWRCCWGAAPGHHS